MLHHLQSLRVLWSPKGNVTSLCWWVGPKWCTWWHPITPESQAVTCHHNQSLSITGHHKPSFVIIFSHAPSFAVTEGRVESQRECCHHYQTCSLTVGSQGHVVSLFCCQLVCVEASNHTRVAFSHWPSFSINGMLHHFAGG